MTDYRDVTPKPESESFRNVKNVLRYLVNYLRHPLQNIANLPDWSWLVLILTLVGTSIISGVLTGFVPPNIYRVAAGFIISPIVALATTSVGALFIYYYFQVFEKRTCSLRKIFTLLIFANIPFFIFQIGSEIVPPISLVGFAFTAMLMAVGLTENFQMEKRRALRLTGILFAVVFLIWLVNRIDIARMDM